MEKIPVKFVVYFNYYPLEQLYEGVLIMKLYSGTKVPEWLLNPEVTILGEPMSPDWGCATEDYRYKTVKVHAPTLEDAKKEVEKIIEHTIKKLKEIKKDNIHKKESLPPLQEITFEI